MAIVYLDRIYIDTVQSNNDSKKGIYSICASVSVFICIIYCIILYLARRSKGVCHVNRGAQIFFIPQVLAQVRFYLMVYSA